MTWSQTPRILLVWPRRASILNRRLDLALVQRRGQELGAQVALVTHEPLVISHARELGIPVFGSSREAQRRGWARPRPAAPKPRAMNTLRSQRELRSQRDTLRAPVSAAWGQPAMRFAVFLLGVLSVVALALFFAPTARVRITPAKIEQQIRLNVAAAPEYLAPSPLGELPAEALSAVVEGRREMLTSGMVSAPDGSARGAIRFTNLTAQPVSAPAGLVVRTLGDPSLRFALRGGLDVPAGVGQMADSEVYALQAGSPSNVPADAIVVIDGELGLQLTVTNPEPLRGGSERLARAPSAADMQKLRALLLDDLYHAALTQMSTGLGADHQVILESVQMAETLEETPDPPVGQAGDLLVLSMRVEYRGLAVRRADVEQVARAALDANLPAGFHAVNTTLLLADEPASLDDNGARWAIRATRQLEADWSAESVAQAVLGRSLSESRQQVQRVVVLQGEPEMEVRPTWWPRMPFLAFRIHVEAQ